MEAVDQQMEICFAEALRLEPRITQGEGCPDDSSDQANSISKEYGRVSVRYWISNASVREAGGCGFFRCLIVHK